MDSSKDVYVPPAKRAQAGQHAEYGGGQRDSFAALQRRIRGYINRVSRANLGAVCAEIFMENLVRGRGVLCKDLMVSERQNSGFADVYAALIGVVNTKLPEIGHLLLRRLALAFKEQVKSVVFSVNSADEAEKADLIATLLFIAHLLKQRVCGVVLPLQICAVLLEQPNDASVEACCTFIGACGSVLAEITPQGLSGVFDRFRSILHENRVSDRTQFAIQDLFAKRKTAFGDQPPVDADLALVPEAEQITHDDVSLDESDVPPGMPTGSEAELDSFQFDQDYEANEEKWDDIRREILGDDVVDDLLDAREGVAEQDGELDDVAENEAGIDGAIVLAGKDGAIQNITHEAQRQKIIDDTSADIVAIRKRIYLTVMSSMDFNECCHKLLKAKVPDGLEIEVCNMVLECCAQEKTYAKFHGLLAQRLCMINRVYAEGFETMFYEKYTTVHRLETNKIRNIARLFAHLLATDAVRWDLWEYVRLNEDETTSSSRIFLKYLLQELAEHMGITTLAKRLNDPAIRAHTGGLFPGDDVTSTRNARFAINFFVAIGMQQLAEPLRAFLARVNLLEQEAAIEVAARAQAELEAKAARRTARGGASSESEAESGSGTGSDADSYSSDSSSGSWSSSSGSWSSSFDSLSEHSDDNARKRRSPLAQRQKRSPRTLVRSPPSPITSSFDRARDVNDRQGAARRERERSTGSGRARSHSVHSESRSPNRERERTLPALGAEFSRRARSRSRRRSASTSPNESFSDYERDYHRRGRKRSTSRHRLQSRSRSPGGRADRARSRSPRRDRQNYRRRSPSPIRERRWSRSERRDVGHRSRTPSRDRERRRSPLSKRVADNDRRHRGIAELRAELLANQRQRRE